jgi:ketosteroid isomerase-like protein
MSEENVAIIRTLFGAFQRRDTEVMAALMSPEVEWDTAGLARLLPDLAGTYQGPEGTRAFWSAWLSSWQDLQFDYDLRDTGEKVVALIRNQRQWGRQSGIETEIPPYAWVYTLRDGRIVKGDFYADQESALEDLGLA